MIRLQTKRIYEAESSSDGARVLVDKLWPRGISKEKAKLSFWAKSIAPSTALRQKFHQGVCDKEQFRQHYFMELDSNVESVNELMSNLQQNEVVTFLFSSKEIEFNNATVLKEYIEQRMQSAD